MTNKIYLITTEGCHACNIMKSILEKVKDDNLNRFEIEFRDFKQVPKWIETNVPFTDFPTIIFVKDDAIKYHINGTYSKSIIQEIIDDLEF